MRSVFDFPLADNGHSEEEQQCTRGTWIFTQDTSHWTQDIRQLTLDSSQWQLHTRHLTLDIYYQTYHATQKDMSPKTSQTSNFNLTGNLKMDNLK